MSVPRFANEIQRDAWAVILAGGDGTRLQKLTSKIAGDSRPKQFCRIFGNKSLLGHTRERLRPIFRETRTVVYEIAAAHARRDMDRAYRDVERIDFSTHVLSRHAERLLVISDDSSGWTDLGNEDRVIGMLVENQIEPPWLQEIGQETPLLN